MKKNYEIKKSVNYRDFTEAELEKTANGTALIIDTDYGPIAIIPMKDKTYKQMCLSETALNKYSAHEVIELDKASILEIRTELVSYDPSIKGAKKVEIFLDF